MARERLDSEVASVWADSLSKARENLLSTIGANLQNPSVESQAKVANATNAFITLQRSITRGIVETRTGISDLAEDLQKMPELVIGTTYKDKSGNTLYADGKGGWTTNDPSKQ